MALQVKGKAKTAPPRANDMNDYETWYASFLEDSRRVGDISRWDFQPEKLRLADNTFYTPDFRVIEMDGRVRFDEVKGFWREDARVKIKVAAEFHPYEFHAVVIRKLPKKFGGGFRIERTEDF